MATEAKVRFIGATNFVEYVLSYGHLVLIHKGLSAEETLREVPERRPAIGLFTEESFELVDLIPETLPSVMEFVAT